MPRYLTPSKLALLVLCSVYVDGHVSATATVPVLSFLMTQLLPPRPDRKTTTTVPLDVEAFQSTLSKLEADFPGRSVWDLFLKHLWTFDSLDSLHVFFEELSLLLAKTREQLMQERENHERHPEKDIRLSRTSPLGLFVRRAQVEFTRMQLEDCVALWKSFLHFREPTRPLVRKRTPSISKTGFDINLPLDGTIHAVLYGDLESGQFPSTIATAHDVEMLLEFQLAKVEKAGERLPLGMRQKLSDMAKHSIEIPARISYIEFLDAWRGGNYSSAYDHLHRHFDYTMQSRDKSLYQYALLNLALLSADFGSRSEAISAITETISIAREHKDILCLNYALSWLFHFGKANPKEIEHVRKTGVLGTDREGLAFLKAKARESGMWSLLSTCYLTEARQLQMKGESLATAFECIAKASHLNLVKDTKLHIGSEFSIQRALFTRLGQNYLASSCNEIFLSCYSDIAQTTDILGFTCVAALEQAAKGHYASAYTILDSIDPSITRIAKHQQSWISCNLAIKLRQAINRNDFVAADHFLTQLRATTPKSQEMTLVIAMYSIELELRRGQLDVAMEIIEKQLLDTKSVDRDLQQTLKFLILKAQVLAKGGLPQKGFSLSLRATALAYNSRYLSLLWEAVGVLSEVLCSLREFDAAVQLLKAIMPRVLEGEEGELIAQSYSYLANAYMGTAGEANAGSSKRKEQMTKVLECLDRAFDGYSSIDHVQGQCEMLAKKATIMHLNGDIVLANDVASKYLAIKKAAREETLDASQSAKQ